MHTRLALGVLTFCIVLWLAPGAQADPIEYGDFIGLNAGEVDFLMVREDSATDPAPLYGTPTRLGNRLIFSPLTFASFAAGGGADVTSGALSLRIRADVGQFLETITIRETGDTTLLGLLGTNATASTINGLLVAMALNPPSAQTFTSQITADPPAPYKRPNDSFVEFTAVTQIDLTGLGIREVAIIFNNNLQTTSEPGTSSFIQKKSIIIDVPEPATLSLVAFAGVLSLRRRRR